MAILKTHDERPQALPGRFDKTNGGGTPPHLRKSNEREPSCRKAGGTGDAD